MKLLRKFQLAELHDAMGHYKPVFEKVINDQIV